MLKLTGTANPTGTGVSLPYSTPGTGVPGYTSRLTGGKLPVAGTDVATIADAVAGAPAWGLPIGGTSLAPTVREGANFRRYLEFDGTVTGGKNDKLGHTFTLPAVCSIVMLARMKSPVGSVRYLFESSGTLFRMTTGGLANDSAGNVSGAAVPIDTWAVFMLIRNGANSIIVVDSAEQVNAFAGTTSLSNALLGGSAAATAIDVAEHISYPFALTLAQRNTLRTNLVPLTPTV